MAYLELNEQAAGEGAVFLGVPTPRQNSSRRRSSRLLLSVRVAISGIRPDGTRFETSGNTVVVNKHGALIQTLEDLSEGMELVVTVPATNRSARARVVWKNPMQESRYGIELQTPCDLWGVHFPPADWRVANVSPAPEASSDKGLVSVQSLPGRPRLCRSSLRRTGTGW